jgi:Flp pilus assembly protein TadD
MRRAGKEAYGHFQAAVQLDPNLQVAHSGLGAAALQMGKHEEAAAHFRHALTLNANDPRAANGLGEALLYQGNLAEALTHYRRAVELSPNNALYRRNLAHALGEQGQRAEAQEEYRTAAQLDPQWPQPPVYQEAWKMASSPLAGERNRVEALKLAKQIEGVSATPRAETWDLLAAAYAEGGRYEEAVAAARKALEAAGTARPELAQGIAARLRLYQERKPYRQEPGRAGVTSSRSFP